MTDMLLRLRRLDDLLVRCMRCGMCQAVCPIYIETRRETMVARGKLALLEALAMVMLDDAKGVKERLDTCLLCGSCQAACPSGVRVLDIFLEARAILGAYLGLPPLKKAVIRLLLGRPWLMDRLVPLAAWGQRLVCRPARRSVALGPASGKDETRGEAPAGVPPVTGSVGESGPAALRSSCALLTSPLLQGRCVAPLARVPFRREMGSIAEPAGTAGITVAFFFGCMVDAMYPRVGHAVLDILRRYGVGIEMPEGQVCCGIPALASGDRQAFDRLVELNARVFENLTFDYLVTACASCTSTMALHWPGKYGGRDTTARAFAERLEPRVMDISAFLVDVLGVTSSPTTAPEASPGPDAVAVTYHDPCHLKKSLGVSTQPRALLRASPGVRFVEMADADHCCGCGGSFTLDHYDLSRRIGQRKRAAIVASGARVVATSCPACMMQLTDALAQAGDDVAVRHVVEVFNAR